MKEAARRERYQCMGPQLFALYLQCVLHHGWLRDRNTSCHGRALEQGTEQQVIISHQCQVSTRYVDGFVGNSS